jgi:hypothetical protein
MIWGLLACSEECKWQNDLVPYKDCFSQNLSKIGGTYLQCDSITVQILDYVEYTLETVGLFSSEHANSPHIDWTQIENVYLLKNDSIHM